MNIKHIIKPVVSGLTAAALTVSAMASSFSVRYEVDSATVGVPEAFGTSAADGKIWVDKSVKSDGKGGFDVSLSALAQEYISSTVTVKPGGSETKVLAADVTFILDMSTSMSNNKDVSDDSGSMITRLEAMVIATNEAIDIIMGANPENRVAVYWFGGAVKNGHVGTFLTMGSYKLTSGSDYLTLSDSTTVKTSSYLKQLGSDGKYSTYKAVSQSTGGGTPTQNGIIYGLQNTLANIKAYSAEAIGARQPYVFLLSDGAASIGNSSWWSVPSKPTTASSYTKVGTLTGSTSAGSQEVAAATILSAAYQKSLLVDAYKAYNSGTEYPMTFYTVGLGSDSAINGADNYAWTALNPSALNTLYSPGDGLTPNDPASNAAVRTKQQISQYVSAAGANYSAYGSAELYEFSSYYQYADTYPKLDAAFTKLAVEVEAATQSVTMPTIPIDVDNVSAYSVNAQEYAAVFTETLGEGVVLSGAPKLGSVTGTLKDGTTDEYEFSGLQSTVKLSTSEGVTTLTWNVAAADIRNHLYKIVDPKATPLTYTEPSGGALTLSYNIALIEEITPDSVLRTEFYSGSTTVPAKAVYTPTRDNPYYYYTNKYVGNVAKLSEIGYPDIDGNVSHYVKGSYIGAQSEGATLGNVYVTSAMVETAPLGTFSANDIGRIIPSITMPAAGAYADALALSLQNCITATGDDLLLGTSNFAFKSGIYKTTGQTTEYKDETSGGFAFVTSTAYGADGNVVTLFGNNGMVELEMGIEITGPEFVVTFGTLTYTVTVYNYTDTEKTNVSVAFNSGFRQMPFGNFNQTKTGITVSANSSFSYDIVCAMINNEPPITITSTASITLIDGVSTGDNAPAASIQTAITEADYAAAVSILKNGTTWADSPAISLMNVDTAAPVADLQAVPAGHYEVYEDGAPTGVIVSANGVATTLALEYYTLNLIAGRGVDKVVGGGTYLAGSVIDIEAVISAEQTFSGSTWVGGTWNGEEWTDGQWTDGEWIGATWDSWTTAADFDAPEEMAGTIIMPASALTLTANAIDNGAGKDVQGKVVDGTGTPVYKLDIAWGDMRFDYSVGSRWNPDTHDYSGDITDAWLPDSFFQDGNNLITTYNHSNADVLVSFDVSGNILDGVDMVVNKTNSDLGERAERVLLERVPSEHSEAPSIPAYLWLIGTPVDSGLEYDKYIKVAVITVTIEAVEDSETTPRDYN